MSNLSQLKELERSGKFAFHGSVEKVQVLEPKQAHHNKLPDGPPAVFATEDLDTAIFMAIYRGAQFLLNESSLVKNNGGLYFATGNVLQTASLLTGYVHVLDKELFKSYREELRSHNSVEPIYIFPVTIQDFTHQVSEISIEG